MYNSLDRTVKIPIRIVNGKVKYFYGGDLPDLDYTFGELIIPQSAVKDHKFIELAQMETTVELFPPNSILMIGVNRDNIPENLRNNVSSIRTAIWTNEVFVKVKLLETLFLQLRGSKKSILSDVKCYIPNINKYASSLNNAYTLISEKYEPHRRSHAGNIFGKCYYRKGDFWHQLENKRQEQESVFEEKFFLDYRLYKLNPNPPVINKGYDIWEESLIKEMKQKESMTGSEIKEFFEYNLRTCVDVINNLLDKGIFLQKKE